MRYLTENIEDQIIATLKANANLSEVRNIQTHAGSITPQTFLSEELKEGFIRQLPFIYVEYRGRKAQSNDSTYKTYYHDVKFRIYVGTKSLRLKREAQLSAYEMLRYVYDSLHGKTPKATDNANWAIPLLDGDVITTPFTAVSPFRELGGDDEILLVNIPNIVVYQSDYLVTVQA